MRVIMTGHSRGLGAAIAAELLRRGIAVLGLARQLNVPLQQQFPELLRQCQLDLTDLAAVQRWLDDAAMPAFLRQASMVGLVNNAATVAPLGALSRLPPAEVAAALSLNVTVPLMLASAVAAQAGAQACLPQCRILHISSGAGRDAYPHWSVYGASKAALDQHARAAAGEDAERLRICSLAPGVIDTGMQSQLRNADDVLFPLRESFCSLQRDGRLSPASVCASRIAELLLADDFGCEPVAAF